jgi:regulator of sigma E protease
MQLLIFLIILSFLIYIHELGHFLMAKRAGVKVDEFGFGYPPKIFKFFTDKHGTDYTLNWLPFGGFVRLHGEDGQVDTQESQAFYSKSKKKRLGIIVAGAVMNFLFGIVAFGAIYTKTGIPTNFDYVLIDAVDQDSPAESAGLKTGDKVIAIINDSKELKISNIEEFKSLLSPNTGKEAVLVIETDSEKKDLPVYVRKDEEIPDGKGAIGVTISDMDYIFYPTWQMPFRGIWLGIQTAVSFGIFILVMLGNMIKDLLLSGTVPPDIAGPVGIGHQVVKQSLLTNDLISVQNFSFAAIISINLAIMNMLPIPALDGGRALFLFIEKIVGRKKLEKIENKANSVGFILLLGLIILFSIRDLKRIFTDSSVIKWFNQLF